MDLGQARCGAAGFVRFAGSSSANFSRWCSMVFVPASQAQTDAGLLLFVLDSISETACRAFVCDDMAAL